MELYESILDAAFWFTETDCRGDDGLWRIVRWADDPLSGDCGGDGEAAAALSGPTWGPPESGMDTPL